MDKQGLKYTNGLVIKTEKITRIRELIEAQGRHIKWYAEKLGYKGEASEFYGIVRGSNTPDSRRRLLLAECLQTTPDKLWNICSRTGRVIALTSNHEMVHTIEGRTMERKKELYISITKEMEDLINKWKTIFTINKLAEDAGVPFDRLALAFHRYGLAGRAKIKREIWEKVEKKLKGINGQPKDQKQ
jgi:hypothetical protein